MRKTKRCVSLAAGIVLILILAACQTPAGRSAGAVVDDSTITTKIKAKILSDEGLAGLGVSVTTFQGEVTLTGAVDTPSQKQRIVQLTQSVRGVRGINNLLKIK